MIKTKADLAYYKQCDAIANRFAAKSKVGGGKTPS
jgi:hypothetical protein